jgi:myo-inositol catabolism protein IolC
VPDHLFILAFDHRGSYQAGLFGVEGEPTPEQHRRMVEGKEIIFAGFQAALAKRALGSGAGVLVDEELGAGVARAARGAGEAVLAMPVEKSGEEVFELQYGEAFAAHIEAFDPDYSKVLVRYNPDGDAAGNARQLARLKDLGDWLKQHRRGFIFELLVPPTHSELEETGGVESYDHSLRPGLVVRAIAELQAAGVEPDVWKIEGLDTAEDCRRVARQARDEGRHDVHCIVLGRGADQDRVERWLRVAAGVDGFIGFAIGRTLWWDPLKAMLAGQASRDATVAEIGARYHRAVDVYLEAERS